MKCPVCQTDQLIVEFRGVELDMCVQGCGTWFDAEELRQLFEVAGAPEMLHDLEQRLEAMPVAPEGPVRRCPRCNGRMPHVRATGASGAVILDRCRRGHGLWFDPGELEDILALEGAEDGGEGEDGADGALAKVREFLGQFAAPKPPAEE